MTPVPKRSEMGSKSLETIPLSPCEIEGDALPTALPPTIALLPLMMPLGETRPGIVEPSIWLTIIFPNLSLATSTTATVIGIVVLLSLQPWGHHRTSLCATRATRTPAGRPED